MTPLDNFMNRIDDMCQRKNPDTGATQGFIKRHVATRAGTVIVAAPLEVVAVAQNIIKAPFELVGVVLNLGVKTVACFSAAECLKKAQSKLPTVTDYLRTIARIVAYSIGTLFTVVLGFLSPSANFKAHCAVGLTVNKREEALQAALLDEENKALEQEAMSAAREVIKNQGEQVQKQETKSSTPAEVAKEVEGQVSTAETAETTEEADLEPAEDVEEDVEENNEVQEDSKSADDSEEVEEVSVAKSGRHFDTIRKYSIDPLSDSAKWVARFVSRGYFFPKDAAKAA